MFSKVRAYCQKSKRNFQNSDEGYYPIYAETDEKGVSKLIIDLRFTQE
jgi:hypothetical protein